MNNDALNSILYQLGRPLSETVRTRQIFQQTPSARSLGLVDGGIGVLINPWDDLQLGGDGAHQLLYPQHGYISTTAAHQFINGYLRLRPSSAAKTLDINTGTINSRLIPPITTPLVGNGTAFAPQSAIMLVHSASSALPSDTAHVDLTWDAPQGTPTTEGLPQQPYVNVPAHTHTVQVDPETGYGRTLTTEWTGIDASCPVPLHGVEYEYLFSHNRMHEYVAKALLDAEEPS